MRGGSAGRSRQTKESGREALRVEQERQETKEGGGTGGGVEAHTLGSERELLNCGRARTPLSSPSGTARGSSVTRLG